VYENTEVKLTGRVASRPMSSGKTDVLNEIAPVDETGGKWKRWVRLSELFEIQDQGKQ